jgi:hypothetical protein
MSLHFCLFSGPGDPLSRLGRLPHRRPDCGGVRHLRRERRSTRAPSSARRGRRASELFISSGGRGHYAEAAANFRSSVTSSAFNERASHR